MIATRQTGADPVCPPRQTTRAGGDHRPGSFRVPDEAADRAAFDALAAVVRAFIASVSATPGALTAEQATQAQAILDSIGAADAGETMQAADEAALQGEVPAV